MNHLFIKKTLCDFNMFLYFFKKNYIGPLSLNGTLISLYITQNKPKKSNQIIKIQKC
jgi:hypothetical protein